MKREIREDVNQGRYEAAERKAHKYFSEDKLNLLVLLEYIRTRRYEEEKATYLPQLTVEQQDLVAEGRRVCVKAELLNRGGRTVTGFAVKVECLNEGTVVRTETFREITNIDPNSKRIFEFWLEGGPECDAVALSVIDLGLEGS